MDAHAHEAIIKIQAQPNSDALIQYIKNYNLYGGFMFGRDTDPDKQKLSRQLDDLLDDGHSGASWAAMMRTIQCMYIRQEAVEKEKKRSILIPR
jgi:hypothetical protein